MPATAIIGYPPATVDAQMIASRSASLPRAGWNRFKAPIAPTFESSAARLRAARAAAPEAWLGCDAAWMFDDVDKAAEFARSIADVKLDWFEDVFPPGDALQLAELRSKIETPIAMGDEQGGSYYPQALILAKAVDVVRIDLTCMGGVTGAKARCRRVPRGGHALFPAHVRPCP